MNDLRKAAQQALEALEGFVYHGSGPPPSLGRQNQFNQLLKKDQT